MVQSLITTEEVYISQDKIKMDDIGWYVTMYETYTRDIISIIMKDSLGHSEHATIFSDYQLEIGVNSNSMPYSFNFIIVRINRNILN